MNAISENMMIRQYKIRQRMQNIFKFIFTGRHNLHIRCVQLTRGEVASLSEQDLLTAGHQLRKELKVIPRNVCITHTQKTTILPVFEYCSSVWDKSCGQGNNEYLSKLQKHVAESLLAWYISHPKLVVPTIKERLPEMFINL